MKEETKARIIERYKSLSSKEKLDWIMLLWSRLELLQAEIDEHRVIDAKWRDAEQSWSGF